MKNKIFYLPKFQDSGTLPKSTERLAIRDNTRTHLNPKTNFVSRTTEVRPNQDILKNLGETVLDFTPVIGDIKGLTVDPYKAYKENGWKDGLTMMGLGLLGLIPFIGDAAKKIGKLQLPSFIKKSENPFYITEFQEVDKDIKKTKSLLAERIRNGGSERVGLKVNANKLAEQVQNYEPDRRTTFDHNGNRNLVQHSGYHYEAEGDPDPEYLFINDRNTTLGEVNTGINGNKKLTTKLTPEQTRQILDHELGHLIDKKYRPEFLDSSTKLFMDQHWYHSDPSEVAQRVGQIKTYYGITDGSKTFTPKELLKMIDDYLDDPNAIDNGISDMRARIQHGREQLFTDWVNENVLSFSPLIILPTIKNNENE